MLHFGADVSLSGFDQIRQPALRRIRQNPELTRPHCHPKLHCFVVCCCPLGNALVAGIAVDELLIAMQQGGRLSCSVWGSGARDQDDQRLLGHQRLHLREKLLPFGRLLGCRQLVVIEAKLFVAHHPSYHVRSSCNCPANGLVFKDFLNSPPRTKRLHIALPYQI